MGSLKYSLLLLFIVCSTSAFSQHDEPILLTNPSFEGAPMIGEKGSKLPDGWFDCGFPEETPPDVHLVEGNPFGVEQLPYDGNSYLGLVVRENDTWERVSQRLSTPLIGGKCYEFSLHLSRSMFYMSPTPSSNGQMFNYTSPANLRVWGGNGYCNRTELLAETSSLVINSRWLEYNFKFEPTENYTYIVFEAYYKTPILFPYNGNILMDNASAIIPVPCDEETPDVSPADEPIVDNSPVIPDVQKAEELVLEPEKPKILSDLNRSSLRQGQTIQIDKLFFKSDSFAITSPSYPVLKEVFEFLSTNPDVVVEIGGHTNNIPTQDYCDRLSTQRAKAVASYLANKGIPQNRIQYKGYGKRYPVVSNATIAGRRKNQRVEIKILSFDG